MPLNGLDIVQLSTKISPVSREQSSWSKNSRKSISFSDGTSALTCSLTPLCRAAKSLCKEVCALTHTFYSKIPQRNREQSCGRQKSRALFIPLTCFHSSCRVQHGPSKSVKETKLEQVSSSSSESLMSTNLRHHSICSCTVCRTHLENSTLLAMLGAWAGRGCEGKLGIVSFPAESGSAWLSPFISFISTFLFNSFLFFALSTEINCKRKRESTDS